MPVLVKAVDLEEGMTLASNVINRYSVLLPHGHTLREKDIHALQRLMPEAMIQIADPLLDRIVDFQDDSHDKAVSQTVRKNVASVVQKVSSTLRSGVSLETENIAGMKQVISEMLEYLKSNPVTMALIEQSGHWCDYLQEHCANVFYLSLVIGNTIRNYIKNERERLSAASHIHDALNLTPLATGALFHDIGMVPLEYLYHKEGPLTAQEQQKVRYHPIAGAEMLPSDINPMARQVIRCHHENQNGTGYPEGLPGEKINIFARIVRVADAYSAAIASTVYHQSKSPPLVLYEMLYGGYRCCYDPVILKVFASIVPPFPIGAKLKIRENGHEMWAVVVRQNPKNLFQPNIIIAFDEWGDPLGQESLQPPFILGSRPDVEIISFMGVDLTFLNQDKIRAEVDEKLEISPRNYSELFDFVCP